MLLLLAATFFNVLKNYGGVKKMNKRNLIGKAILYIIIALIVVMLLSSALKFVTIVAIIACAIYFAWKEAKR